MTDDRPESKKDRRLRPQIAMTVHPDTVDRMRSLCDRFKMARGPLVDKLVLVLWKQYEDKRVYCTTGEACRFNRQDVPEIL